MALRRKLFLGHALLFVSLLAMAALCLRGLLQQRRHLRALFGEYAAMQLVESAEVRVIATKSRLRDPHVPASQSLSELQIALDDMRHYKALLGMYDRVLPPEIDSARQADAKTRTRQATARLAGLVAMLQAEHPDPATIGAEADAVAEELAQLLKVCNTFLNRTSIASDQDLHRAVLPVALLAVIVPLALLAVSLWQYRRIMMPLQRLRNWSRRIARGDFSSRCQTEGPREFVELGSDFNRMADELQAFYRRLEEMVAVKSRELVRSERLASVGYLAAGVAHEINSPLNIISGYAQLSAKRLKRPAESPESAELLRWQDIIRDEAFRCKQITGKLLSLCRGGGGREVVSLTQVASDVALMVRGLRNFQGRRLNVLINPADPFAVHANLTEMKQVMLNLTINALEAVSADGGEVIVDARRVNETVELSVIDNGRGMDAATLERVFEPFFTNKRGAGEAGTGLGLSITFAIVADHGGRITAQSDGPGKGSRFQVTLPASATSINASESHPPHPGQIALTPAEGSMP